ncbi:unnamed protein product, partial [Ectocarpus fasciculatus]
IYNEEVRDLLAVSGAGEKRDKLELKEDPNKGVYVKGLTQAVVSNQEGINCLMDQGQKMRTVGATAMNETSSRSHSIFTIVVEINDVDEAGKDHIRLNLVDLAGSERASKTGASGNRLKEGCKINLSLSALGNVISALVDGNGKHIPYRDSKLTRLLQDSLGGNTKTLMVAAISPADYNYEETLSTLRYANRAKNIKNKPKINEDPKDAMLRQYKEEIEALKQQLAASLGAADSSSSGGGDDRKISPAPSSGGATAEAAPSAADPLAPSREPPPTSSSPSAAAAEAKIEHNPQQPDIEEVGGNDGDGTAEPAATAATAPTAAAGPEREGHSANGGVASGPSVVAAAATGGGEGVERGQAGGEEGGRSKRDSGETEAGSSSQVPPDVVVQEKIVERVVVEEKVVVQEVEVEVESQKMAEHRQALENYSRAVEEQRNRLGQELETSVIRADVEKQAREEMARKLDALQTKVIGLSSSSSQDRRRARRASVATRGGAGTTSGRGGGDEKGSGGNGADSLGSPTDAEIEDPEVIIARRNAEHRRMQAKLRQKRRKENRLELERVRALEEKAEVEKEMADVVGQAEEKERRLNKSRKKLERKLVEAREEIEDLAMEHETEREELLDSIRNQNKELQLWEQVARQILSSKEIARIWERGEYNEDDQTWVLPHIKPRGSYVGDPCKLPLLAPPGALHGGGGGGFDEDTNSPASGRMSSARKDRRRGGGRSEAGDTRASMSGGGQLEGGGSRGRIGSRASVSGKGGGGGERGGSGNRRGSTTGRGANEDRPPRRAGGEEAAPKEGGGGVFNEADRPWESFAGRESGAPRSKAGPSPASAILWDSGDSPADDHYRGLTPPISPAPGQQSFSRPSRSRESFVEASDRSSRYSSHPDSASSPSAAAGWGFSGDGSQREEVELPSQGGGDGKIDRCPSRQGGTRTGATSSSRLGREHRQQQQQHQQQQQGFSSAGLGGKDSPADPDSLIHQGAESIHSFGGGGGEAIDSGGGDRVRAKSRRNKTRPSVGGAAGWGGQEDHGAKVDWGSGSGEHQSTRSSGGGGSGRKERSRPKSKARRGERGDPAAGAGGGAGRDAPDHPSVLDSMLWKGGEDVDRAPPGVAGASPGSGVDLYDFGG